MAEIIRIYQEKMPALRFIGKVYGMEMKSRQREVFPPSGRNGI